MLRTTIRNNQVPELGKHSRLYTLLQRRANLVTEVVDQSIFRKERQNILNSNQVVSSEFLYSSLHTLLAFHSFCKHMLCYFKPVLLPLTLQLGLVCISLHSTSCELIQDDFVHLALSAKAAVGGGYFGKVKCIISPPLQGHINCLTILLHFPIDLDTSLMSAPSYSDNLAELILLLELIIQPWLFADCFDQWLYYLIDGCIS